MINFVSARKYYLLGLIALFGFTTEKAKCQTPDKDFEEHRSLLKLAIDRGFERISKGVDNYPKHRDCFSCHHQAVPLLAYRFKSDDDRVRRIVEFSQKSLSKEIAGLQAQEELGGRGMTLGYALWTMAMSHSDWGELGDQLVKKAVTTQQVDGRWRIHSIRPPAASSELMATTLVLLGLSHYLDSRELTTTSIVIRASVEQARYKAMLWKASQPEPTDTEDLCASLWFDYLARRVPIPTEQTIGPKELGIFFDLKHGLNHAQIDTLSRYYGPYSSKLSLKLRKMQNQDGGWGSQPGRESDAYSTATVLLILAQVDREQNYGGFLLREGDVLPWDRKGLEYLLSTQKPDGSWHVSSRANPVQEFFDNGDPHESDQFISMQATAWAVAALSGAYRNELWPLNVEAFKK
ncbi:MAG: prenyltransferase/squalene oxidase repeat-containing protein [Pirellula sp.]